MADSLEAVSEISAEYDVDDWIYYAVKAGQKECQESKSWSYHTERGAVKSNHNVNFHWKPEQCERKDSYDKHLKDVLLSFKLYLLIGCSHLPWNLPHPNSVDDGDIKNDDFQQGQSVKHDEISRSVDCVKVHWNGWFPYFNTVHGTLEFIEGTHVKKDRT